MIKITIVDLISSGKSDLDQNRRSKSAGLESELSTICFINLLYWSSKMRVEGSYQPLQRNLQLYYLQVVIPNRLRSCLRKLANCWRPNSLMKPRHCTPKLLTLWEMKTGQKKPLNIWEKLQNCTYVKRHTTHL